MCDAHHGFICQKQLLAGDVSDDYSQCPDAYRTVIRFDLNAFMLGITIASVILIAIVGYFADLRKATRLCSNFTPRQPMASDVRQSVTSFDNPLALTDNNSNNK